MFHMARLHNVAPAALLYNVTTSKVALGAVVMRIPALTDLSADPVELIATGDFVRVDGERGQVAIWKSAGAA